MGVLKFQAFSHIQGPSIPLSTPIQMRTTSGKNCSTLCSMKDFRHIYSVTTVRYKGSEVTMRRTLREKKVPAEQHSPISAAP